MASTTAFAGKNIQRKDEDRAVMSQLYDSIHRLSGWLEKNDYRGYDTFDGLNARFVRPLTFDNRFLRTVLQQGVRRFPIKPAAAIGNCEEPFDQGHGLSGPRVHAASRGDRRAGLARQGLFCASMADGKSIPGL